MAKFTTISVHAPRRARPPPVILYMALTDFASAPPKHPLLALEDISSTVPRRDCRHHPYARHSRSTSNIPASPTPDSGVNSDPNVPGSLPDPQVTTVAPIPAHRFKIQRPRGVHSMGRWQLLRSFAMGSQAKALSDFVTAAVVKDKMLDLNKSFEKQSEEKILALQNKVASTRYLQNLSHFHLG
ncbi:hypothetical protein VKT23_012625 [Stygiomarasmius scandens]|uniref:Uncharacterized protein n=1 Tax=Marasmiellus scandens TaxID=2682957 RepID=A0ABR1J9R1_9AGAR